MVWLGLDGGGSTLRALALRDGDTVYRGQSGAANLASTPDEVLHRHLAKALEGCPEPDAVFGAFAGAVDAVTSARAEDWLRTRFPRAQVAVGPDARAALRACPEGTSIGVIAGTGSLVCSESNGAFCKSGGRGYLLGDEGSGFRHGAAAARLFLDFPEAAPASLRRAIAELYEDADASRLVGRIYSASAPHARLAKLAPALGRAAAEGWQPAQEAIRTESEALARIVRQHRETFSTGTFVGLAGGLWKAPFVEAFREALGAEYTAEPSRKPAVEGAAELARELLG